MTQGEGESTVEIYLGWLTVVLALSLPLYRPWVSLASALIMLLWLFGKGLKKRLSILRHHRLTLAVLVFLGLNLLSLLWSSDPGAGLRYLTKYRYLLLIPIIASSIGPVLRRRAETAFMFGATVSVALSYGVLTGFLHFRGAHPGNPSPTMSHLDFSMVLALASLLILNRAAYTPASVRGGVPTRSPARISHQLSAADDEAPHPAVFSRLGVLDVLSSTPLRPSGRKPHWAQHLAALASKSGKIGRLAWLGCFFFVASGLLINIGRSGQLALAGALVVFATHRASRRSKVAVVGAVAAVGLAIVAAYATVPRFHQRIDAAHHELHDALETRQYDSNLGERVAAVIVSKEIFRADPLLGTGVGGAMPAFRTLLDSRFIDLKPAVYWYPHLHNQYLQVVTQLGLAGLMALAWIFWELMRGPYPDLETQSAAIILGCVYLLGFLGDPYLHKQIPLVAFTLIAGLLSARQVSPDYS